MSYNVFGGMLNVNEASKFSVCRLPVVIFHTCTSCKRGVRPSQSHCVYRTFSPTADRDLSAVELHHPTFSFS